MAGTLLVLPTFLGIFIYPGFEGAQQVAYYIILPALFNVGWAFVQISNMALVNSITFSSQRRDQLITLRNAFTFVANVLVLAIALVIFAIVKDQIWQFRILALIIIGLGGLSSLFYMCMLREPYLVREAKAINKDYRNEQKEAYE